MTMIVLRLLSLLGLKSRWHRHFSPRPLDRVVFSGGRGVGGFVDSWPKTLVPSASNRSTPEWTRVDSRQGQFDEEQLRARTRGTLGLVGRVRSATARKLRPNFARYPARENPCRDRRARAAGGRGRSRRPGRRPVSD